MMEIESCKRDFRSIYLFLVLEDECSSVRNSELIEQTEFLKSVGNVGIAILEDIFF